MSSHAGIFGPPEAGVYCQTLSVGQFFLLVLLHGPPDQVTLKFGHEILEKFEEILEQSPEVSPKEFISVQLEKFTTDIRLGLILAKLDDQILEIAASGDVGAKIIRSGKIINLVGENNHHSRGKLDGDDLLILASAHFLTSVKLSALTGRGLKSADDFRDQLLPQIENAPPNPQNGAILVLHSQPSVPDPKANLPPAFSFKLNQLTRPTVHLPFDTHKKRLLYFVCVALTVLVAMITFQLRTRTLEQKAGMASSIEKQGRDGLVSAKKLVGLNDQTARDILLQTKKDLLDRAVNSFGQDWQNDGSPQVKKVQSALSDINDLLTIVTHVNQLSTLDLFYDFSLLKAAPKIVSVALVNGEIAVLDQNNGAVYTLSTENKTAGIITGNESLKSAQFLDLSGGSFFVFSPEGIFVARKTEAGILKKSLAVSSQWGQIAGLKLFAGNIYLLDRGNSQIWKYQATDFGFSEISPYLRAASVDFSRVSDFAIDGYVWVLSQSGNIVKFSSGNPENLQIAGLDKEFSKPIKIFASDETENLYCLDLGNNRVVVLSKKGTYVAQYVLPAGNNQEIQNFVIDEKIRKGFLLTSSKVFAFELKQ